MRYRVHGHLIRSRSAKDPFRARVQYQLVNRLFWSTPISIPLNEVSLGNLFNKTTCLTSLQMLNKGLYTMWFPLSYKYFCLISRLLHSLHRLSLIICLHLHLYCQTHFPLSWGCCIYLSTIWVYTWGLQKSSQGMWNFNHVCWRYYSEKSQRWSCFSHCGLSRK